MSPGIQQGVNGLREKLGTQYADSLLARSIGKLASGDNAETVINELAQVVGSERAKTVSDVGKVLTDIQQNAAAAISSNYKVDGGDVLQWVHENVRSDIKASLFTRLYHGDRSAIAEIYKRYQYREKF